jgi:hypothetical protein
MKERRYVITHGSNEWPGTMRALPVYGSKKTTTPKLTINLENYGFCISFFSKQLIKNSSLSTTTQNTTKHTKQA